MYSQYIDIRCIGKVNMNFKGSLQLLILQTLSIQASHGYQIAQQIKARSQGVLDFKEGTLYPALHNLEQQGLLDAFNEDENGRTRRYYRLTDSGRAELQKESRAWKEFVQAVNLALGENA
jgi:PadR family transcriptional regulator, regulatory protein PadR